VGSLQLSFPLAQTSSYATAPDQSLRIKVCTANKSYVYGWEPVSSIYNKNIVASSEQYSSFVSVLNATVIWGGYPINTKCRFFK